MTASQQNPHSNQNASSLNTTLSQSEEGQSQVETQACESEEYQSRIAKLGEELRAMEPKVNLRARTETIITIVVTINLHLTQTCRR